ncbi:MAG: hypothetical protein H7328_10575 [Bdellovibrio sp.]|nr:hypothetical protein [Bdellovibrio sp.]
MFTKIKNGFVGKSIDLSEFFKKINLKAIPDKTKKVIKSTLAQIDDHSKVELTDWLLAVQQIKANSKLSKKEKEVQLVKIKPSEAVVSFFNSLIDLLILKIPVDNKNLLKTGFSGVGFVASFMNFRKTGIILLILHKALPKFILTNQFDDLSGFLTEQLKP